jgi:hypothetical protein
MGGEDGIDILDESLLLELITKSVACRIDLFMRSRASEEWSATKEAKRSDLLDMVQRRVQSLDHIVLAQSRYEKVEVIHLGNLLNESSNVLAKHPVVQIVQDVQVDSMPSACQECCAVVTSAQGQHIPC